MSKASKLLEGKQHVSPRFKNNSGMIELSCTLYFQHWIDHYYSTLTAQDEARLVEQAVTNALQKGKQEAIKTRSYKGYSKQISSSEHIQKNSHQIFPSGFISATHEAEIFREALDSRFIEAKIYGHEVAALSAAEDYIHTAIEHENTSGNLNPKLHLHDHMHLESSDQRLDGVMMKIKPSKEIVKRIVEALHREEDGTLSIETAMSLLSGLSGVEVDRIPEGHHEVTTFMSMTELELVDAIVDKVPKRMVDLYYESHLSNIKSGLSRTESLFDREPSYDRVIGIIKSFRVIPDGTISDQDVSHLLTGLLGVPVTTLRACGDALSRYATFSDCGDALRRFEGLTPDEMVTEVTKSFSHAQVEQYYLERVVPLHLGPVRDSALRIIQGGIRGGHRRRHDRNLVSSSKVLQASCRGYEAKEYVRMELSATSIQALLRGSCIRHEVEMQLQGEILQGYCRGLQMRRGIDHSLQTHSLEHIRFEAAAMAHVRVEGLPSAADLSKMVKKLHTVMADDESGKVRSSWVIQTCQYCDGAIPMQVVEDSLYSVGVMVSNNADVTLRQLYFWVVLMFGEASEADFLNGVNELGQASFSLYTHELE